jgi:cohesin complex subunit SA-1/2
MSSSVIRSFRHTATVIALETQTALCTVAATIDSELEMVQRQREGEKKKKNKGKGATGGRDKEFELKAQEIKEKRTQLSEFIKEFFDGYVHPMTRGTKSI